MNHVCSHDLAPEIHVNVLRSTTLQKMARPKSKSELLELSQSNYKQLLSYIDHLSDPEFEFPSGTMNRNVRDVLAHLHHWHLMLLEWYKVGMTGEKPDMPAE